MELPRLRLPAEVRDRVRTLHPTVKRRVRTALDRIRRKPTKKARR